MGGINKKAPSSKAKGKEKGPKQPKEPKRPAAPKEDELQVLPQERVAAVRPFWEGVQPDERPELLTLDITDLRTRAAVLTERYQKQAAAEIAEAEAAGEELLPLPVEPTLSEVLEEGLSRLQTDKKTWKVWQWPADDDGKGGAEFYDAESFRNCVEEQHLDPELKALLPKDPPGTRPIEKPAEAALRQRMSDLLSQVHTHNRQLQEEAQQQRRPATRRGGEQLHVRDANVDLITTMLAALEKEHEFLYHAVLFPVTSFVCEVLPEGQRESSRTELFYEDLDRLSPDDVARISEWITEKVDGFSAKLKPEAKDAELEEEEEGIGDVDLFTLVDDSARLAVNAKWLGHLAERQLGEDGHPRKVGPKEDPHKMGLVLEWVYGTIVSTAEKARDGAKRALGGRVPTARAAHEALVTALADQASWAARATSAKELLAAMLASRRSAADLAKQHDIRPQPPASEKPDEESRELPDEVIMAMLRREVLLTRAKLHALCYEQIIGERKLRSLKTQLRQGEPEFDRLKRELEEVKNAPRGLEGTFRSAAEMERHRAAAADAAIEEQLEVQTSFRQHGARLQGIYDKRQRTEVEMAKRDQELKQLQGWRSTVQSLLERFQELVAQQAAAAQAAAANGAPAHAAAATEQGDKADADGESAAAAAEEGRSLYDAHGNIDAQVFHAELAKQAAAAQNSQQESTLQKLRQHFQRDVRKQLYTDEDDRSFFAWIQRERKAVEERLADGAAALQHLEMALVNTACDDPGAAIGAQLALPLLQERLDRHALEFATQRAAEAEAAIVKMDEEKRQRELAAKERKVQAKSKVKTKARSEKEKLQAEKEAADVAARAAAEAAVAARLAAAEEEKKQRAEEALRARLEEEAIMEARRQELLSEEGGYWSRRMAAEQAAAEQLAAAQQALIESANMEDLANGKPDRNGKAPSAKHVAGRQPRRRGSPGPGIEQPPGRAARDLDPPRTGSGSFGRKSPPVPRPHAATNGSADRPLPPNKKARGPDGLFQAERPGGGAHPAAAEAHGMQRPLQNGHAPAAVRRSTPDGATPSEAPAQPSGEPFAKPTQPQPQPPPPMAQAGNGQLQSAPSTGSTSGRPLPPRPVIIVPPAAAPRAQSAGQAPASVPQQQRLLPQGQQQQSPSRPPPVLVVPPPAGAQPSGGSPPPQTLQRPPSAASQQPPPLPQQQQQQQQAPNGVHPDGHAQRAGPPPPQQLGGPPGVPPGSGVPHGGSPPPQPPHYYQGPGSPQRSGPGMPLAPPQQQPGGMLGTPPPHMMMQQQFGGPGAPPPHMMPPMPGGMMHVPPGAPPYMMGGPQVGGPPAISGPPAMAGAPGAFMVPPAMHGGFPPGAAGPMPPHLNGPPPHPMQQAGRAHLPPDMGPPPPPPGALPFPPMQMAADPGYPGPGGMPSEMLPPPHSHPGAYPPQGPHQQQPQQHFLADPHAPPPPPGTPPLPEGGTPKGVHNRQQMWDAAQRQQQGGGSAPPAPSTPPRATMLRAAAQPFVPRATAPAFVPGGASSQRSGSPPASEDSAASVTAPAVPPQQEQQGVLATADEHQPAAAAPQDQAPFVPQPQQQPPPPPPPQALGYVPPHLRRQHQPQPAQQQPPQDDGQRKAPGSAASTGDSLDRQWSGSEASSLTTAPAAAYGVPPRQQPPQQPPLPYQQAGAAAQQQQHQQQAAHQPVAAGPPQEQRLQPPSQSNSAMDLRRMDAAAAAEAERMHHSASQPALGGTGGAAPPRAWSSIAAANSGPGSVGSSGSGALPASLRASSQPGAGISGVQQAGQQQAGQQQAARRPGSSMRAASAAGTLHPSGSSPRLQGEPTGSGGTSPTRGTAAGGPGGATGVHRAGGVLWDGLQPDALSLKLVRGLTSESGQNNCFLNVVVQSLWHLGCFRSALLGPGRPAPRGPPADQRVLDALLSIFRAFAAAPGELDVPNGEAGAPESPTSDGSGQLQGGWAVSPAELREALGALSGGGFGLSDMHDAAEVLGELLACLHRAEVGATDASSDPLLPRRVRPAALSGGRPGAGPAMAMAGPRSSGADKGRAAVSMVLRLFGLEVQVPCPPEDDGKAPGQPKQQQPQQQQRPPVKGAPGDLAQYWEYCHLVPAKGLRTAYDSLLDGSFEEMLRAADDEEGLLSRAAGGLANGAGGAASAVVKTLLRRPRVFILGVVWETPQAKDDAIASTVAALRTEVDVGAVFRGVPPGPPHRLRCLVAYSGHHYQAYALVEGLGRWLLFDDAAIKLVGGWPDVAASMRACRHQPSLLFYERADQ